MNSIDLTDFWKNWRSDPIEFKQLSQLKLKKLYVEVLTLKKIS